MSNVPRVSPEEGEIAGQLLAQATVSRDALPYTTEFDKLKRQFAGRANRSLDDADFWSVLCYAGKRGLKVKGPRKKAPPTPSLTIEEQLEILRLLPEGIGTRDNLPYTPHFDRLHKQFSKLTGTKLTKHEFWRAVSRVGKRSRKPKPVFESAPLGWLPNETVRILERLNPWWQGKPAKATARYRRWAFHETWRLLHLAVTPATAIRGPRRVGKTTIMEQTIEQLLLLEKVSPKRILHVQFDEVPQLGTMEGPVASIVRWFEKYVLQKTLNEAAQEGKPAYLFFDELQNLRTWAPQLKMLVDHESARVLVSGSSSLRILAGQDSLAGRLSMIELGPLRLSEIAGVRRLGELYQPAGGAELGNWTSPEFWLELCSNAKKRPAVLRKAFDHFSEVGGYPICHNNAKATRSELAASIVETVVERTIQHDQPIASRHAWDRRLLNETFRLVCLHAGQSIKTESIREEINRVLQADYSSAKVADAIQFLVDAMLVHRIEPLEALKKRRANGSKLCLCDHFVREAWLQECVPLSPRRLAEATEAVSALAGHLIESVVGYYLNGIPGLDVSWLPARPRSNEPEVDYILTIGLKRIPIEIKYTRGRLRNEHFAGLESFCRQEKYNAPFGLVITQEKTGRVRDSVIAVPASVFLSVV